MNPIDRVSQDLVRVASDAWITEHDTNDKRPLYLRKQSIRYDEGYLDGVLTTVRFLCGSDVSEALRNDVVNKVLAGCDPTPVVAVRAG